MAKSWNFWLNLFTKFQTKKNRGQHVFINSGYVDLTAAKLMQWEDAFLDGGEEELLTRRTRTN